MSGSLQATTSTTAIDPGTLAKEKAELQKLVAQYAQKIGQGAADSALAGLAKTIKAEAKALGVNVTLPKAPGAAQAEVDKAVATAPPSAVAAVTASPGSGGPKQVNLLG